MVTNILAYYFGLDKKPVSLSPDVATPSVHNNQTISTSSHSCSPEQIIESHSEEIPDSNVHGQPENTNNLPISQPICDESDPYPVSSSSTDDYITQHIYDHVIDEGDEHVIDEGDKHVIDEGDEHVIDEGNEHVIDEGDEHVIDEGDEHVIDEGDEHVIDEGDEHVIDEGNEHVIDEGDEHVIDEGNEHVIDEGDEHVIDEGDEHVIDEGDEHVIDEGNEHVIDEGDEHVIDEGNEHVIDEGNEHVIDEGDEHVIDEGNEHNRQITGAPLASMMTIENPDIFNGVVYVAPAKRQKPLSIISDSNFEAMSNPDKFPVGSGSFTAARRFQYRLLSFRII